MSKIINKGAKILVALYLIFIALSLIIACFYMTQYSEIHIASKVDEITNEVKYNETQTFAGNGISNQRLFNYFNSRNNKDTENPFYEVIKAGNKVSIINTEYKEGMTYAQFIDNFRINLNNFNSNLVIFGMTCIVLCVLLFVFANHSRKIYYSSNLIIGVVSPLAVAIYSVVMLLENMNLQGVFNSNIDLFRITHCMMTSEIIDKQKDSLMKAPNADTGEVSWNKLVDLSKGVNDLTFNLVNVFFIITIALSLLLIVFTILKYKATSKRRLEVIERAVQNND